MRKKPGFDKTKFESFEAFKLSPAYIEYRLLADAKKYDQRIREATREYPKGGKYIPAGKNKNVGLKKATNAVTVEQAFGSNGVNT